MKKHKMRLCAGQVAILALLVLSSGAWGEELKIDMVRLLADGSVITDELSDGVHKLHPKAGRQLFLVPFVLPERLTEPMSLEAPLPRLVGAAFVGWYLNGVTGAHWVGGGEGPAGRDASPPLFAKRGLIHPDGTVEWSLERALPESEPGDPKRLYAVKVHASLQPARPQLKEVTATGPDAGAQRRQAAEELRLAMEENKRYLELLRAAPERFTGRAPRVLFAVYIVPKPYSRVAFAGEAPLPWGISGERLTRLRGMVSGTGQPSEWRPAMDELLAEGHPWSTRLAAAFLAANGNLAKVDPNSLLVPIVKRIVAEGDSQARQTLVDAILQSPSPVPLADAILETAMSDKDPGVAVSAVAARVSDAGRRGGAIDREGLEFFAKTVSKYVSDPAGTNVDAVLGPAMRLAGQHPDNLRILAESIRLHSAPESRRSDVIASVLAGARRGDPLANRWLDRDLLSPSDLVLANATLDQVIDGGSVAGTSELPSEVVSSEPPNEVAPKKPAPAGGTQPGQPPRQEPPGGTTRGGIYTPFDVMDRIAEGSEEHNEQIDKMTGLPGAGDPGQPAPEESAAIPTESVDPSGDERDVNPMGYAYRGYALDTPEHNFFKLLRSEDVKTRGRAWEALLRFRIAPGPGEETSLTRIRLLDTYAAFGVAASAVHPTPQAAVVFARGQESREGVVGVMLKLLTGGSGDARLIAMQEVAQQGAPVLNDALLRMTPDDRQQVAELWYHVRVSGGEIEGKTVVTGLLRLTDVPEIGGKVVGWFAEQVSTGHSPPAPAWRLAVGNDDVLVRGMIHKDEGFALGCAAAILSTVMPPDEASARRLRDESVKISAKAPDAEQAHRLIVNRWNVIRSEMARGRLKAMAGKYEVSLTIGSEEHTPVVHRLGVVELKIDAAGKASFVPMVPVEAQESPLALRLADPAKLAAQLSGVAADLKRQGQFPVVSIELLPDSDGRWTASTLLPDQSPARLTLTPVR